MKLFGRFWNKYPYSDFHELNLDWLVQTVQDLDEQVQAMQERVDAFDIRLTTAEGDIDALEVRATSLEGRATALEGRATALESELESQNSRIAENATAINALTIRTTVNEQNINIIDGRVDDLEEAISGALPGYQGEYYQNITDNGWTVDQDVDTTITDYHFEMTGQRSGEIVSLHGKIYFGMAANATLGGPLYKAKLLDALEPTTLNRHVAQRIICSTDSGDVVFLTLDIYRQNESLPGYIDIHLDPDTPHMPQLGEEISTGYFTIAYVK